MFAEKNIGATPEMIQKETLAKNSASERYWYSKVGNWAHGVEYAFRQQINGVISVPLNPGNLCQGFPNRSSHSRQSSGIAAVSRLASRSKGTEERAVKPTSGENLRRKIKG
jgi:hypothetical protein